MGPIRAKFRCLSITEHWSGTWDVHLAPVMDGPSEENRAFWRATPNGKCELQYRGSHPFKSGVFYYIDFVSDVDGLWTLDHKLDCGGTGGVRLTRYVPAVYGPKPVEGFIHGLFEATLDEGGQEAFVGFGSPKGKWSVTFTPLV